MAEPGRRKGRYTGPKRIKWRFDILPVLEALVPGAPMPHQHSTGKSKALCPFHPDTTPSAQINWTTQRFVCFACGKAGDAVDLIGEFEGLSRDQARSRAAAITGERDDGIPATRGGSQIVLDW